MKATLRLLLFCVLSISYGQDPFTTDYKVHYELNYHIDSTNMDTSASENLYLFTGEKLSVFVNYNEAHKEELKEKLEETRRKLGFGDMEEAGYKQSLFKKQHYKDLSGGNVLTYQKILDNEYAYFELDTPLEWEVLSEQKEFDGYSVQKATTSFAGRDYEAWFTMEIPIPNGPYIFSGLPGLIVELYDTNKHYHFQMIAIEKLTDEKVWEMPKYKEITRSEFLDYLEKNKDYKDSEFLRSVREGKSIMWDEGGNTLSEAEIKREQRKSRERKNNPIELE